MSGVDALVAEVRAGSRRAIGRAITAVESIDGDGRAILAKLHGYRGTCITLGLTGPPGVGKSSLISALVRQRRAAGQTVGVVSVDPSSPFTHGAVLGDRIRLSDHFTDPGVFIRSMASRGQSGGVAEGTAGAATILMAAGFDCVIIEAVGAGQNEVDIAALVDTVAVVLMPGSGDGIQAIKAGIMEIPDILVINKADHPGTAIMRRELDAAVRLVPHEGWRPPVIETQATTGEGVDELWDAVERHRAMLGDDGLRERRTDGMVRQLRARANARRERELERACPQPRVAELAQQVVDGTLDPDSAVDTMIDSLH